MQAQDTSAYFQNFTFDCTETQIEIGVEFLFDLPEVFLSNVELKQELDIFLSNLTGFESPEGLTQIEIYSNPKFTGYFSLHFPTLISLYTYTRILSLAPSGEK